MQKGIQSEFKFTKINNGNVLKNRDRGEKREFLRAEVEGILAVSVC